MSEYLLRAVDIVKTFAGVKALQGSVPPLVFVY